MGALPMPTRTIRDGLLDSAGVNELDDQSFIFYVRLMLVVDDFGRFYADPRLLLARMFPLQLDRWSLTMVSSSLSIVSSLRTSVSGVLSDDGSRRPLVSVYEVSGKKYLQINKFEQRLRQQKKKFPGPDEAIPNSINESADNPPQLADNSPQSAAGCAHARAESESESESERNPNPKPVLPSQKQKLKSPELLDPNLTEFEPGYWTERMYDRHPKKADLILVSEAVKKLWEKSPELVRAVDKTHERWCKTDDWTKENGKYCPKLAKWIDDRGYTQEPSGYQPNGRNASVTASDSYESERSRQLKAVEIANKDTEKDEFFRSV